jgi:hypothetical protein
MSFHRQNFDELVSTVQLYGTFEHFEHDPTTSIFEPMPGGDFDGLIECVPPLKRGAESTPALLAALQTVRQFEGAR